MGIQAIAEALGLAGIKAAVAITGIIAGGRLVCLVTLVATPIRHFFCPISSILALLPSSTFDLSHFVYSMISGLSHELQLLRPVYKRMAENHNAEIFAANTLLVVLGTSVMTARVRFKSSK